MHMGEREGGWPGDRPILQLPASPPKAAAQHWPTGAWTSSTHPQGLRVLTCRLGTATPPPGGQGYRPACPVWGVARP